MTDQEEQPPPNPPPSELAPLPAALAELQALNHVLRDLSGALSELTRQTALLVEAQGKKSPMGQREVASFILMGLASRLQPIHVNNPDDKRKVVDLAFEMAKLALAKSDDE